MRIYAALAALLGWFALILQLAIMLVNRPNGGSLLNEVVIFISFFTILTNLLLALILTAVALGGRPGWKEWFCSPSVQASATMYIAIVGIAYHLLLRNLWNPKGGQLIADLLLHTVMPLVYVVYWLFFGPRTGLRWKTTLSWLIYPAVYLVYSLARGSITGAYPYPFIDVNALGYAGVMVRVLIFMLAFLGMGWVVVALGRWVRPFHQKTRTT